MDLETFHWLLSDDGQALLAEATAGDLSDAGGLRALEYLRRLTSPERAAAAYEIARLRVRAAAKFSRADRMYFTREALEQASGETIASYRAARFAAFGAIADLCCGVGGDTLALAAVAPVVSVDRDQLRLAMAAANARALGLAERIAFEERDLEHDSPPAAAAIFFDPARRADGRRIFKLAHYRPPVALVREWLRQTPAIGVKIAPGIGDEELAELDVPEVEFISVDGELKEAVLWFGPLAVSGRRATLLRSEGAARVSLQEQPGLHAPLAEPLAFLYEPDPAVIRGRGVAALAEQIDAAQLDREIAYLTAERFVDTPFARCWRVLEWLPFNLKRLRARLRAQDAGAITVKKRGSPLDTDALARQLSGHGARPLVVVLSQVAGSHAALICEGPIETMLA